jgi:hypothetical protein
MIALLSHSFDTAAQQAVAAWPRQEATLLTTADVCTEGWVIDTHDFAASTFVAGGQQRVVGELRGVVNLMPFVEEKTLLKTYPDDRPYVASELTAFLAYWLNQLPCPVLNRPAPDALVGSNLSPERFGQLARRVGLCVAPSTASEHCSVIVVGGSVVNPSELPVEAAVRQLAQLAGLSYLEVFFSKEPQGYHYVGVRQMPQICNKLVSSALHSFFGLNQ